MTRASVPISILYSTTGPYAALGREAVLGAMAAISEINRRPGLEFVLEPVVGDPGGSAERHASLADQAIRRTGCRHVIGTITSWSRKEVIPVIERHGALLWYAFPHEGYEASDRVLYLGACPNQHLLPLFDQILPRYGRRPFIVGSNYIWGWEISRIARELIEAVGGEVLADRFVPLGSEEVGHLLTEIRQTRPDFILSNLVGRSAHALLRGLSGLRGEDPYFGADRRPVVACNLCVTDLDGLSPASKAGHITISPYFDQLPTAENRAFKARMESRSGIGARISGPFAAAHMAVTILADAIADTGSDDPEAVRKIVTSRAFATSIGSISVDPRTNHAGLRPHVGRSNRTGDFEVFHSAPDAIPADPYLIGMTRRNPRAPALTVVK